MQVSLIWYGKKAKLDCRREFRPDVLLFMSTPYISNRVLQSQYFLQLTSVSMPRKSYAGSLKYWPASVLTLYMPAQGGNTFPKNPNPKIVCYIMIIVFFFFSDATKESKLDIFWLIKGSDFHTYISYNYTTN